MKLLFKKPVSKSISYLNLLIFLRTPVQHVQQDYGSGISSHICAKTIALGIQKEEASVDLMYLT